MTAEPIHDNRRKLPLECQSAIANGVEEGVARGVETGTVRAYDRIFDDPERCKKFWKGGYDQLVEHSKKGAFVWIGNKVWTILTTAVFGLVIYFGLKYGVIK